MFSSGAVLVQPGLVQQITSARKDETPQRGKQHSKGVLMQWMPILEVAASLAGTPQRVTAARREAVQLVAAGALPAVLQDAEPPHSSWQWQSQVPDKQEASSLIRSLRIT